MVSVVIVLLASFLSYYIASTIWNLTLHPLAKCPGPFLARISSLPSIYHAWKGDRHIWTWQCFETYGNKFRASPNLVLFRSSKAFGDIYGSQANVKKSRFYETWPRNARDRHTLNTTDIALHSQKRRLLSLVFTKKSIREAGIIMAHHIDQWIQILTETGCQSTDWSQSRDISTLVDHLVFDIFGDLFFGRSFETKWPQNEDNPFRSIPQYMTELMIFMYPIGQLPCLSTLIWLKPRGLDRLLAYFAPKEIDNYYTFLKDSVTRGVQREEKINRNHKQDMLHFLCNAKRPDSDDPAFSPEELLAESNLLMISGTHTTTIALKATLFYICSSPRVYGKLVQEVRSMFSSVDEINYGAALSSCHYLRACIDEALRMAPPGPSEFPREVLSGGTFIDGEFFQEGIIVGTSGWSNGYDTEFYGDATIYRPERWIISTDNHTMNEEEHSLRTGYNPFLRGNGSCLGKELAILEMMMVIGRTVYQMDVRIAPGSTLGQGCTGLGWGRISKDQYQLRDAFTAIGQGPELQCRRRKDVTIS